MGMGGQATPLHLRVLVGLPPVELAPAGVDDPKIYIVSSTLPTSEGIESHGIPL